MVLYIYLLINMSLVALMWWNCDIKYGPSTLQFLFYSMGWFLKLVFIFDTLQHLLE